jgi:hypothetical protein
MIPQLTFGSYQLLPVLLPSFDVSFKFPTNDSFDHVQIWSLLPLIFLSTNLGTFHQLSIELYTIDEELIAGREH